MALSLVERQAVFALNVAKLITYIFANSYKCTLGEAFRTKEQSEIYAKEGKGIANSLHCKRLGMDINLFSPEGVYLTDFKDYEKFGIYWETLHKDNRWGGRFTKLVDSGHFEMMSNAFGSINKK